MRDDVFDIYATPPMRAALGLYAGHRVPGEGTPPCGDVGEGSADNSPDWDYSEEERGNDTFGILQQPVHTDAES